MLSAERSFVVQIDHAEGAVQTALSGRVEHVLSGRSDHFSSLAELEAFLRSETEKPERSRTGGQSDMAVRGSSHRRSREGTS